MQRCSSLEHLVVLQQSENAGDVNSTNFFFHTLSEGCNFRGCATVAFYDLLSCLMNDIYAIGLSWWGLPFCTLQQAGEPLRSRGTNGTPWELPLVD